MTLFETRRHRGRGAVRVGQVAARSILTAGVIGLFVMAGTATAKGPGAISIVDRSFTPTEVTIAVGDTVTWTVTQAIADPHSVTSGAPGSNTGEFDSGITLRNNGDSFSHTFTAAGTFPFYCIVHPAQMKGTITVLAAGQSAAPAPTAAPVSAAPESAAPASEAPASGAPASPAPGSGAEERPPVGTTERLIAAGVIGLTLLVLFGAATYYRRLNR